MYICDVHKSSLRFHCQRFSNNSNPEFTDEEVLTIYLFCGYCQRYFNIKEIHTFAKEYLSSWFPKLPSYQTFCGRLNMLSETFKVLVETMIQSFKPKDCDSIISIVDSMPIVTCKGKNREGKVATEITSKGYCSTKNMYYYGMKLHMVGQRRSNLTFSGNDNSDTGFGQRPDRIQKRMRAIPIRKDGACRQDLQRFLFL